MPTILNNTNNRILRLRYRAYCTDDTFIGRWRQNEEDAKIDAAAHLNRHPGHTIEIEIEQRMSIVWTMPNDNNSLSG